MLWICFFISLVVVVVVSPVLQRTAAAAAVACCTVRCNHLPIKWWLCVCVCACVERNRKSLCLFGLTPRGRPATIGMSFQLLWLGLWWHFSLSLPGCIAEFNEPSSSSRIHRDNRCNCFQTQIQYDIVVDNKATNSSARLLHREQAFSCALWPNPPHRKHKNRNECALVFFCKIVRWQLNEGSFLSNKRRFIMLCDDLVDVLFVIRMRFVRSAMPWINNNAERRNEFAKAKATTANRAGRMRMRIREHEKRTTETRWNEWISAKFNPFRDAFITWMAHIFVRFMWHIFPAHGN